MPSFSKVHRVNHSPRQMFELVADVERYPEFLPLCEALTVRSRLERDGRTVMTADMTVGYKAIRETFTSQVILDPATLTIDVKYLNGPFRRLDNRWRFLPVAGEDGEPLANACDVDFFIDYEFRSRLLGALMGTMFDTAFRRFTAAFEERAGRIYAKGASQPGIA